MIVRKTAWARALRGCIEYGPDGGQCSHKSPESKTPCGKLAMWTVWAIMRSGPDLVMGACDEHLASVCLEAARKEDGGGK